MKMVSKMFLTISFIITTLTSPCKHNQSHHIRLDSIETKQAYNSRTGSSEKITKNHVITIDVLNKTKFPF